MESKYEKVESKYENVESKYVTAKQYIKQLLNSGGAKPGTKLPSIRELSRQLDCSKNTIIRAFDELEKEHLIYSVPKSGYFAVLPPEVSSEESYEWIDFSAAAPDPSAMPYEDMRHCLNRAIDLYKDELFSYSDPQGFATLRRVIAAHLADSQVFARPGQVSIVSGSQQTLYLLSSMPFPNGGTTVLVEQPTYAGMVRTLNLLGTHAVGITRGENGIDLNELERHFRSGSIKFFYTIPRFHNPLGTSLPKDQKRTIVKLAARYGVYIVEDDYLADLETNRKNDPIFSYDDSERTVYMKSFSKVMLPGLRIAAVVLPQPLLETFKRFKWSVDSSTSALSQAALEMYIGNGMYARHAANMRERYASRIKALQAAFSGGAGPGLNARIADGGIFTRIALDSRRLRADDLIAALKQKNVLAVPTSICYLNGWPRDNGIRLSVIRTDERQIAAGVDILRETAAALSRKSIPSVSDPVIDWI